MHISTAILPTFALLAAARGGWGGSGSPKPTQPKGQLIDANYDDITVVPAVPAANTLTTYKGLNYTGFATNQVGVAGTASLTGVAAHSKPNNIVSGFQQTSLTGQNAGFSIASGSKYFDLLYFYYGCSVNTVEGAEGLPQQCTFNVRGYRNIKDANPVAQQQFSFTPVATQLLAQPMLAQFGSAFKNIQRAEIVQLESPTGEELNVIVLDDVVYNLYK